MTEIIKGASPITLINVFTVAPDKADNSSNCWTRQRTRS